METFRKLGIEEFLLKAIEHAGFEKPTSIQEGTIPQILKGNDIIAGASTGSGKTLAFGAGILQKVHKGKGIQALVLTPTRELAEQIANALITFTRHKPLKITTVYGGVAIEPQMRNLQTADIVVGTPGRMLDHLERKTIDLSKISIITLY